MHEMLDGRGVREIHCVECFSTYRQYVGESVRGFQWSQNCAEQGGCAACQDCVRVFHALCSWVLHCTPERRRDRFEIFPADGRTDRVTELL